MEELYQNPDDNVIYNDLKHFIYLGTKIITQPEDVEMSIVEEHSYNYLNVIVERSLTIYKILTDDENIDIFSAEILFRSLLETYIKFYDLFLNSETQELLELRILREKAISAWEDSVMFEMIGDDNPEDRETLSQILKERKDDLTNSATFQSLKEEEKLYYSDIENWYKKKYNKIDISELAHNAGISENNVNLFYKYTSNFTHGDPATIVQAGIFIRNSKPEFFNNPILIQTSALLSKSILTYSEIKSSIEISDDDRTLQEYYWTKMNQDIRDQ
jgi:hypothetical protein